MDKNFRKIMVLMYINYKRTITSKDFEDLGLFLRSSNSSIYRDLKELEKLDLVIIRESVFDKGYSYLLNQKAISMIDKFTESIMI